MYLSGLDLSTRAQFVDLFLGVQELHVVEYPPENSKNENSKVLNCRISMWIKVVSRPRDCANY